MNRQLIGILFLAGSLIVYNPLPWPRSGIVEWEGKRYFVKDVPPSGYTVVPDGSDHPAPRPDRSDPALENDFFRLRLDAATGSIASLVDKRTGCEWVDPLAGHRLGQYTPTRPPLHTDEQLLG